MFAAPPPTQEHQPQSWTYEHRHRLTERVARLDAGSLRRVLVLVFGDANGFRPRDEFTIDFEGLDRAVCETLDSFLDEVNSDAAYKRARRAVGLPEAEPPAPELPPRPLPPRPRGLDPPIVVRVPRPPGFRCGGRRYSDPPAPLPGQSPVQRPTAPAVAPMSPPSRTGSYSREGGHASEKPRHPARPASDDEAPPPPPIMEEESEEDDNESDGGAWEAPRPKPRVRPPPKISYSGRFPCPAGCGRAFDHAPAAIAHGKTCKEGTGAPPPPPKPAPHKPGRAPRWTQAEDAELVSLIDELGEDWEKIASKLKTNRTSSAVEQRYIKIREEEPPVVEAAQRTPMTWRCAWCACSDTGPGFRRKPGPDGPATLCDKCYQRMRRGETKDSWGDRGEYDRRWPVDRKRSNRAKRRNPLPTDSPLHSSEEDEPPPPKPPKVDDGRGVELREKGGDWKFYKSQKDAAEAFPGLIQGDISRLINNPREVSRHIRERFEARNVGPKTTRQLNHPPSQKPKVEKPRGAKVVKRDRSPSPAENESDAYAPDAALAKALSALSPKDTDGKREVLERHGFSCTKKGDRWTYQRGSGRAIRCLATLQSELAAPPAKKVRVKEDSDVVVEGSIRDIASSVDLGALPARCRVQAPEASKYRACSVLAQERGLASSVGGWHRHLVLYDDKLSLQWVESTGSRPCKWRRGDSTKSEREREADTARKLGPKACDDMMAWLCSLDVSDPLLHADPLVRNLLPKKCERLRDYGVTLRRVKERLAERDYDDAFEFSEDVRRVHETILSVCSSKLPRSWDEDAPLSKNGDRETILHAAQVFRSAFESRWSSLLKRISAESLSEKRATAAWRQKPKRGSSNANYDKGAGAVGKVVEVYWEGEGEWFRGRLTRYRDADGKHRCDYEDGESEWLVLAENSVRFPDNDVVLSPTQQPRKVCEPVNGFSCQKLGVLVWAKTGKYPWWPAETCLLAVDELTKHFPPNPLGQQRGDAKETTMVPWRRPKRLRIEKQTTHFIVLYFGDVQMDAVDADHVAPYSIADPREREVPAPGLGPAVDHCHKRAEELEIATDDVADP